MKYPDGEWNGVTTRALQDALGERKGAVPLREILSRTRLPLLHPDQPLDFALRQIGDWPLLSVVSRADFSKLVGVISIEDILRAYRGAGKS